MSKLCSLKQMEPGSVVMLPEKLGLKDKFGMVLGTEYERVKDSNHVFARIAAATDLSVHDTAALSDEEQWEVVENAAVVDAVRKNVMARTFPSPEMELSIGSDPEIFALRADGRVIPAWEYMLSEKEALAEAMEWTTWYDRTPDSVMFSYGVPAYWDGVQAEFAPWAKNCLQTHCECIRHGLRTVLDRVRKVDLGAKLTIQNVVEVGDDILKGASDEHIAFRCTPSYNVYNDPGFGVPDARTYKYRCAGGHIHLGFPNRFTAPSIEQIVRGLDGVLGLAGVSLAAGIDNPERRKAYGRAGEFRLPKHGIEYRVLSNFWLGHPAMAMLVFDLARQAIKFAESGLYRVCWEGETERIQEVINSCDVVGARKLLTKNQHILHALFDKAWPVMRGRDAGTANKMRELAVKAVVEGPHTIVPDMTDIEKNWKLDGEGWIPYCKGDKDSWQSLILSL